jgi:hypothetical protein
MQQLRLSVGRLCLSPNFALRFSLQGRLQTALAYLDMAPGEGALDTAVLRDRIYRAGGPELAATAPAPPFPFVAEEVAAAPGAQGRVQRQWLGMHVTNMLPVPAQSAPAAVAGVRQEPAAKC